MFPDGYIKREKKGDTTERGGGKSTTQGERRGKRKRHSALEGKARVFAHQDREAGRQQKNHDEPAPWKLKCPESRKIENSKTLMARKNCGGEKKAEVSALSYTDICRE